MALLHVFERFRKGVDVIVIFGFYLDCLFVFSVSVDQFSVLCAIRSYRSSGKDPINISLSAICIIFF